MSLTEQSSRVVTGKLSRRLTLPAMALIVPSSNSWSQGRQSETVLHDHQQSVHPDFLTRDTGVSFLFHPSLPRELVAVQVSLGAFRHTLTIPARRGWPLWLLSSRMHCWGSHLPWLTVRQKVDHEGWDVTELNRSPVRGVQLQKQVSEVLGTTWSSGQIARRKEGGHCLQGQIFVLKSKSVRLRGVARQSITCLAQVRPWF